ncbi:MAG: translocation/assembly module TamB domain-containing protein [Gammaproteobacteria bacterium]|nr:translocation/assembly module TamB domain-containing protein [Gammaproteobacteria bacterium]
MKRLLRIGIAGLLLIPLLGLVWLLMTQSGLRWAYHYGQSYLPGELSLDSLEGQLLGPITIQGLDYTQDGTRVSAEQIRLEWLPATLLTANVNISRLQVRGLHIVLPPTATPAPAEPKRPLSLPEIRLPWRVALNEVQIDEISLDQNGKTLGLEQIRLRASSLFSQLSIDELRIQAETFHLTIAGDIELAGDYAHQLQLDWQARLPSGAVITGDGPLNGDLTMTRLQQQLTGAAVQLDLDAQLRALLDSPTWQARADISAFDMAKLGTGWPAATGSLALTGEGDLSTASLTGSLAGRYPELGPVTGDFRLHRRPDNRIEIEQLLLHAPERDTRLQARGDWRPGADGGEVALALSWQHLRWPLKTGAWFDSAVGSGWIEGSLAQYRVGLATDRLWPQAPPSFWYASAAGNLDGLRFDSLRITALDGETTIKGQLNWSPQLHWQAQASIRDINPASYLPLGAEWSGRLGATLTSTGRLEQGQLIADADITELSGKLRGYPVSLRSRVGWRDAGLDIERLDLRSGSARIKAEGRIGERLQLDWSIAATDLAALYPQALGQLQAQGALTGPRATPTLQATLKGQTLSLREYQIGSLDGALTIDMFQWQKLDINLAAKDLMLKGIALQSLSIVSTQQGISAEVAADDLSAVIELQGRIDDQGWQGRIARAELNSSRFQDWRLKAPVELQLRADTLKAPPLCWQSQDSELCLALQRSGDLWQARLDARQLPLGLLSPWLPENLGLEGTANAHARLDLQADGVRGEATIELPPGAVTYPLLEGERDRWEYRQGSMAIFLTDKDINARASLDMRTGEQLRLSAELPGAQLLTLDRQRQPLHAEARLTLRDLGLVEVLIPEVQGLQGEVDLNLAADGTLARPRFSGQASLNNSEFRIPRLGLHIERIKLQAEIDNAETLHYTLGARSGDGTLAVQGQTRLDPKAGWPTDIDIKGEAFEVARIPEARVLITPDLQLTLQDRTIDIKGKVHIPFARLQPKDLSTAARVSEDVVIIGQEPGAAEKWSITTRVRLTLGERVTFYGFGFEGRLGGSLLLEDEPGQLTRGTGEITIPEGRYRAYGQRLEIENGRLLYTGGPLGNPGLDLRAVRQVGEVTAGLYARGSLKQPQIELFTIPAMGQTDALSYLILGRPIENASGEEGSMMAKAALALGLSSGNSLARALTDQFGLDEMRVESSEGGDQASLVMGRYLSPRLYVSYGVGLIEAFNTLTLRYQISEHWQLKGESGEYQGADILFTIER